MNQAEYMLDLIRNSPYATGADFSHWKGDWDLSKVDMAMYAEVMDFVILRVGYGAADGRQYIDSKFHHNYDIASQHNIPILGYWYFSSNSPWNRQLEKYVEYVGDRELYGHVNDVEDAYNTASSSFGRGAVSFLKGLEATYPGKRAIVYAGPSNYMDLIRNWDAEIDRFPYWVARYPWYNWTDWDKWPAYTVQRFKDFWTNLFGSWSEWKPPMPRTRGEDDWEIAQVIAASGIGNELGFASDELDFNVTRRTKDEFYKWLGWEFEPEEPGEDDDMEKIDLILEKMEELRDIVVDLEKNLASHHLDVMAKFSEVPNTPETPPAGVKAVKTRTDYGGQRVYLSWYKQENKQGAPLFIFYPSDGAKVAERVYVKPGATVYVERDGRVVGDGGNAAWKVANPIPVMDGSQKPPEGVQLYIMERFIG